MTSKMPFLMILEGRFQVLEARTRELRPKTMKNHKNDENGQNVTFWGCRRKPQNRCFFSSRKPKWVCVICGVPLVMGVSEGVHFWDPFLVTFGGLKWPLFNPNPPKQQPNPEKGHFRGVSKMTPKMTLFQKCQKVPKMTLFWTPQNDIWDKDDIFVTLGLKVVPPNGI